MTKRHAAHSSSAGLAGTGAGLAGRLTKETQEIIGQLTSPSQSEVIHLPAAQAVDHFALQVTPWGSCLTSPFTTFALASSSMLDGQGTSLPLSLLYPLKVQSKLI